MSESIEPTPQVGSPIGPENISFQDFQKIDIRTAKVIEATRVPNSTRLLKLKLEIGGSEKQCLAGIGTKYEPAELVGKMIVVVTNLIPRKMMGLTSEVMLLAASQGEEISPLILDREVGSGAKVT